MDNALAFRSNEMSLLLEKWGATAFYRAAYRASGNGIVERCHRTIKAMAERSGKNPIEAVFWYNMAPRYGQRDDSVPQRSVFTYGWRLPCVKPKFSGRAVDVKSKVEIGDEVWVRPGTARCTTQWDRGIVTGLNSTNNVEVDGVPRHILDLRPIVTDEPEQAHAMESEDEEVVARQRRYPSRDRVAPIWMGDYVAE